MVKSKSEETKEYKILLETRVPFHPQERVCSSVLLPDRLTVTSGVHIFGSTAQGTEQPSCLCITPCSALSPLPPSHHLLHLHLALGEPVQLTKPSGTCALVSAGRGMPAGSQPAPELPRYWEQ